jgi:hypothetical protein
MVLAGLGKPLCNRAGLLEAWKIDRLLCVYSMRVKVSLEAIVRPGYMQKSIVQKSLSLFGTVDYSDIST